MTCAATTTGSGGYPVVPITITGYDADVAPALNADGSANSQTIVSAQVAFWMPKAGVDAAIADTANIVAIAAPGTSGYRGEVDTASSTFARNLTLRVQRAVTSLVGRLWYARRF